MKTFKFRAKHIKPINKGVKTTTWRLFDDAKDTKAGDHVEFLNREDDKRFAIVQIISVDEKTFADLNVSDWEGHGFFSSDEEMFMTYKEIYKQDVNKDTVLRVVKFKV